MIKMLTDIMHEYIREGDIFTPVAYGSSGQAIIKSPKTGILLSISIGKFKEFSFHLNN